MTSTTSPWTSRTVSVNDLDMHILECIPSGAINPPLVLLLHGFPELSYSWRHVIRPIAHAGSGYHVVAPDQRGFGRTTSRIHPSEKNLRYTDDLAPYRMLNLVNDVVALASALGHSTVFAVVGHDFGSPVAGFCALARPDVFRSAVFMSAPFTGPPPPLPPSAPSPSHHPNLLLAGAITQGLAELDPPRKHYTTYYSTPEANQHLSHSSTLREFLRIYFYVKSASKPNSVSPHRLPSLTLGAAALLDLPKYYVMPLDATMPETIQDDAPPPRTPVGNWLTESDLDVYVSEYSRTGFQGGLNWYRCILDTINILELASLFPVSPTGSEPSQPMITVPTMFIAGKEDWGVYQLPGAAELMRDVLCWRSMAPEDFVLVEGAGHWVQQEQPEAVVQRLLTFFAKVGAGRPGNS